MINLSNLLGIISSVTGIVSAVVALYVGKQVADLRVTMLLEAQQREDRMSDKLDALTQHLNQRLDGKQDKAVGTHVV